MEDLSRKAIESVQKSEQAYCKFITDNDVGGTGGHQSGYHIHKNAWALMFDEPGRKGSNKDSFVTIKWQEDFETKSRFIYYGVGTRDEYRLTRFQRGFPFLSDENIGDLLVLARRGGDYYEGFVLSADVEIEEFFSAFGISSAQANRLIDRKLEVTAQDRLLECFNAFIKTVKADFPSTMELSRNARDCYIASFGISSDEIIKNPDRELFELAGFGISTFQII